jgi:hypothetical protein
MAVNPLPSKYVIRTNIKINIMIVLYFLGLACVLLFTAYRPWYWRDRWTGWQARNFPWSNEPIPSDTKYKTHIYTFPSETYQIHGRSSFIVRTGRTRTTKRLLSDNGTRWFIVYVKVSSSVTQLVRSKNNGIAVLGEQGTCQGIRWSFVSQFQLITMRQEKVVDSMQWKMLTYFSYSSSG